ncbi:MAG: thioredoxin family protein [Bacteroidales bacterium]|jgi:thiol:disulfide interchange protein DsbD|nr:thioredoxin family protein [Bacteroidales bacterium]
MLRKSIKLTLLLLLLAGSINAQIKNPVKWKIEYKENGNNVYDIIFNATIEEGWHLYDLGPYNDGPNPTQFYFDESKSYKRVGNVKMLIQPKVEFDEMFQMKIGYFLNRAQFAQSIQVLSKDSVTVKGYVEWMVCDNGSCLPPTEYEFAVKLPGAKGTVATAIDTKSTGNAVPKSASAAVTTTDNTTATDKKEESIAQLDTSTITPVEAGISATIGDSNQKKSIWGVVLEAILWGFIALLTPCVFPMVPMTVSFFLKNSQAEEGKSSKSKGKIMASFYGLFIVALYTLPIAIIILVTYFAGGEAVTADIFNWLATHWLPNIIFFLVFMIFAASFFGAFEITLPSWMVNKSDTKSDKGGLIGVFFMALTLVLVSFSCTGPIVGTILIKSTQGEIWEPIITMFAFSVAFALPFTIFAFAPSLLKDLPKSGGWLNSVKVVLGFIEVALGFKFLSVADQTYHWGILDREVYLAIWIVVFTLLGFYLLGKIRFAYDTPIDHIGVGRLTLSIIVFTFVVYMIPGMWGAPLKALSGYMPPQSSQDFNLYQERHAGAGDGEDLTSITNNTQPPFTAKYSEFLHLPHGLQGFFEYDEAIAYAKKVGKPLFVDFTGHGCVNCREMEARVWSDPRVLKLLREKFVILALYADDKKEADEKDWVTNESGRVLKSIGKINSHLAMTKFNVNAQPYYAILNPYTEEPITQPRGYDLDVENFLEFLKSGSEVK